VQEALINHAWVTNIQGGLPVAVIIDYLQLWDLLANFQLQPGIEDRHISRFSARGQYSAKTAFEGFFLGATTFRYWEKLEDLGPRQMRFFHVDCCPRSLLDCGSSSAPWPPSSRKLPYV
jgi:hypothetical protein